MKALTWKEPFASLMLYGKIETRTWKTNVRGKVLICASKVPYNLKQVMDISGEYQYYRIADALGYGDPGYWGDNCGYAIALGNLVDCRPMKPTDENDCFVQYNPDLWCHIYEDVRAIDPILFKGKQGWSEVHHTMLNQIKYTDQELAAKIILKQIAKEKFI